MVIPTLKTCHFEASEIIMTKFKSQVLLIKKNQILRSWWEWQPSLIPVLWNIDILLHKQGTLGKHFEPYLVCDKDVKILLCIYNST